MKPIQRPAATTPIQIRIETRPAILAATGNVFLSSHGHPTTRDEMKDQSVEAGCRDQEHLEAKRGICRHLDRFRRKQQPPVRTWTANPAHAHGSRQCARAETGVRRMAHPRRRRSRITIVATRAVIPSRCSVSTAGKSHNDSRTAAPTGVCSSHRHRAITPDIVTACPLASGRQAARCARVTCRASRPWRENPARSHGRRALPWIQSIRRTW